MTKSDLKKKGIETEEVRRSSGLFSFGADVRKLVAPLLGQKGLLQADILTRWKDILGPELSAGVFPFSVSFSRQKKGAVLTVKAFSGAFAVEFTARKEQIMERLNSYFGDAAICDIRVLQGGSFVPPSPVKRELSFSVRQEEEVQQMTAGIENDFLRQSMIQLGLLLSDSKKD